MTSATASQRNSGCRIANLYYLEAIELKDWEYLTIKLKTKPGEKPGTATWDAEYINGQLCYYGQEGWELVSTFCPQELTEEKSRSGALSVFATFKRRAKRIKSKDFPFLIFN